MTEIERLGFLYTALEAMWTLMVGMRAALRAVLAIVAVVFVLGVATTIQFQRLRGGPNPACPMPTTTLLTAGG